MRWDLFWRYVFDLAMLYPGAMLCYMPVQNHLRFSIPKLVTLVFGGISALILGSSLVCTLLHLSSNALILPIFILAFLTYGRTLSHDLTTGKAAYAFATMTSVLGACSVLASL